MLKINSNNIEIKICSSVFQVMRKYIQLGTGSLEAGGILIGKENISDDNEYISTGDFSPPAGVLMSTCPG